MNLDRLFFDKNGSVLPVIRTSSGAKSDFLPGETVFASSACKLGGGRNDDRFFRMPSDDPMNAELYGSACLAVISGADALYRFFFFEKDAGCICIHYKCADRAHLKITLQSDQETKTNRYHLPPTENWHRVSLPIKPIRGRFGVSFELQEPVETEFYLAKFCIK